MCLKYQNEKNIRFVCFGVPEVLEYVSGGNCRGETQESVIVDADLRVIADGDSRDRLSGAISSGDMHADSRS